MRMSDHHLHLIGGDEDDGGEPNPPTGDGDDGRQYES